MKGLEIARDFFFGWGLPFLDREFSDSARRIAAGRLWGSDVLGGDDKISRDHAWGPQFEVYLSEADYSAFGRQLSGAMNAAAPNPWKGHRLAGGEPLSVTVESIPGWFGRQVGVSRPPVTPEDWSGSQESQLYFVRHGAVWVDGSGELTAWRVALHEYPKEVQRKRLSEECFRVRHHGEYNFVRRMAGRRDPLAISICLGEFAAGVMRLTLLLAGDFTPYWKWLAFEFRKRPEAAVYTPLLEALVVSRDIEEQVSLVKRICAMVHQQLVDADWVTGTGSRFLSPLLNDKIELDGPSA